MENYLLYTIVTEWNEPPRARHQIANELKKDGKVYFVEKNKTGWPHLKITEPEKNIIVITPFFPIDYRIRYRTPGINELYHRWLLYKILSIRKDFDIVISFDYTAPAIPTFFKNVIFYCADDNVGFGNFNPRWVNNYHTRTEKKVASKSRICVVTSNYMYEKISASNPKTYNIPLGAPEIELNEIKVRDKINPLPVLGLVGYLDSNLDDELIYKLLSKYKIVFIGPASASTKEKLASYNNAVLIGPKIGDELYHALQEVDVCIAPYDLRKINKGATPNKLWLYLAVGRPGIITRIPNIEGWKFEEDLVYICDNNDIEQQCLLAYKNDNISLTYKRIAAARASSWYNRVREMKEAFYAN